ncbi:VOC family protein, partial [Loktanella sp. DJP18]|uniref:VOC family protein n=1 Tax=Loktanella sp. DJP18 TaxID=3409788 RepID=UPI003BB4FB44
ESAGGPPDGGFSPLAPELLVSDLPRSLEFWCDLCGFTVAYRRQIEGFAYLQHPDGAQIMLSVRSGAWESAPLDPPFGRGVLFQIVVADVRLIARRCASARHALYMAEREVWRDYGDREGGRREIALQDPDGYLVLFCQSIGSRSLPA